MRPHFKKLICDSETPISLYTKIASRSQYSFLLESAEPHEKIGRYSFIGFEPLVLHIFPAQGKKNPLTVLQKSFQKIRYIPSVSLPMLQAGFVGYFSYETARHFENINLPTQDASMPEGIFFLPRYLLVFDHRERILTLIAFSQKDLKKLLGYIQEYPSNLKTISYKENSRKAKENRNFEDKVFAAKEKICSGEIFQIVVSQKFEKRTSANPFDLYRRLRLISPSPYMYYLQYPAFSIIGSSPETLVRTENDEIIIRPIAGTRIRGKNAAEDKNLEEELKRDEKERAEHMMLVDLGRNDIGRMAKTKTVRVTRLMEVEKYSHVMHLVSEIRCKRRADITLFDIFRMAFPAGTLTGAPKIRAMEIIAQLEKEPRGIYGGAVGYFDLSGNMDFAIAIRTMLYQKGLVSLRAGAGIVYDSKPTSEHKECCLKAAAPLNTLTP